VGGPACESMGPREDPIRESAKNLRFDAWSADCQIVDPTIGSAGSRECSRRMMPALAGKRRGRGRRRRSAPLRDVRDPWGGRKRAPRQPQPSKQTPHVQPLEGPVGGGHGLQVDTADHAEGGPGTSEAARPTPPAPGPVEPRPPLDALPDPTAEESPRALTDEPLGDSAL
jgi:hypothetical protein